VAKEIRLPKLSPGMTQGTIVVWLVAVGDAIAKGQPILQLETDKAVLEVEAPASGTVTRILHVDGAQVDVDAVIALFE